MLFEDKIPGTRLAKERFKKHVRAYASALGIKADWLMALMMHESGLRSDVVNSLQCVGLIQFCPVTYRDTWGLSLNYLKNLTPVEQLQYVYKYLEPYAGKMHRPIDVFLATFYPYALTHNKLKDKSYKFGSEKSLSFAKKVKQWNPAFDVDKNGVITSRDYICYHNNYFKKIGLPVVDNIQCNSKLLTVSVVVVILIILTTAFFVTNRQLNS